MTNTCNASQFVNTTKLTGAKASVRYGNEYRFNQAVKQASLPIVSIENIIQYTNEFLNMLGINSVKDAMTYLNNTTIDYQQIQDTYNLDDQRDIVWMKFTKDGYLGVVSTRNDINFNQATSVSQYQDLSFNTSGIILHHLNKQWDQSFVLVFPLKGKSECATRSKIECGIGQYLISKGVPILDYYSHTV